MTPPTCDLGRTSARALDVPSVHGRISLVTECPDIRIFGEDQILAENQRENRTESLLQIFDDASAVSALPRDGRGRCIYRSRRGLIGTIDLKKVIGTRWPAISLSRRLALILIGEQDCRRARDTFSPSLAHIS